MKTQGVWEQLCSFSCLPLTWLLNGCSECFLKKIVSHVPPEGISRTLFLSPLLETHRPFISSKGASGSLIDHLTLRQMKLKQAGLRKRGRCNGRPPNPFQFLSKILQFCNAAQIPILWGFTWAFCIRHLRAVPAPAESGGKFTVLETGIIISSESWFCCPSPWKLEG